MKNKGFYIATQEDDVIGFGITFVYMKAEKDFQIAVQFLDMTMAIGYVFEDKKGEGE